MSKRKYNHFKEKSSNFIGDDDEVIESVPSNLPDWIPEEAWIAYVDMWYPNNPEDANVEEIEERYEGYYPVRKDFVEYYFEELYADSQYEDYDDTFEYDPFFSSGVADLDGIGRFIFWSTKYGDAVYKVVEPDEEDIEDPGFIGDDDVDSEQETELLPFKNDRDNSIYKRMIEIMTHEHPGTDFEDYAKAYIIAVSEYDNVYPRDVVYDLQNENPNKGFIIWERGENIVFEDYAYYNGHVFCAY